MIRKRRWLWGALACALAAGAAWGKPPLRGRPTRPTTDPEDIIPAASDFRSLRPEPDVAPEQELEPPVEAAVLRRPLDTRASASQSPPAKRD